MSIDVEIIAQDLAGIDDLIKGGANRIELCTALAAGGLTPPPGLIALAVKKPVSVQVLIRSIAGGFELSKDDKDVVAQDIKYCVQQGVDGVVVGALKEGSEDLDVDALSEWKGLVGDKEFTIHRCVDVLMSKGMSASELGKRLKDLGVTRVLTSGGAPKVGGGLQNIEELIKECGGEVQVMAGGGLVLGDIPALVDMGISAIHTSAKTTTTRLGPSGPGGGAEHVDKTDEKIVAAFVQAVRDAKKS